MKNNTFENWGAHLPDAILKDCRNHPLQRLLHTCAIGRYLEVSNHKAMRPEPINEHILIYCQSGKGYYELDGTTHQIRAGEFFVIPAGMPHEYGNIPGEWWTILWVHFAGTHAAYMTEQLVDFPHQLSCPQSHVHSLFTEMLTPLAAGWNETNLMLTNHILWHFLGLFTMSSCVGLPNPGTDELSISERVITLFNENLAGSFSLAGIAGSLGLSPSHLSAVFKTETGASPIDYLIRQRIIEAARLLQTSQLRIGEVSRKVGYDDTKFFSKTFRRIMGVSPRGYRQLHATRV